MENKKINPEFVIGALQDQLNEYSIRLANSMALNNQLLQENKELKEKLVESKAKPKAK